LFFWGNFRRFFLPSNALDKRVGRGVSHFWVYCELCSCCVSQSLVHLLYLGILHAHGKQVLYIVTSTKLMFLPRLSRGTFFVEQLMRSLTCLSSAKVAFLPFSWMREVMGSARSGKDARCIFARHSALMGSPRHRRIAVFFSFTLQLFFPDIQNPFVSCSTRENSIL
jgi:hypothetical protein